MARALARRLALPYTEIDALFHGPGWTRRPAFEADVGEVASCEAWIFDSWGYQGVRDLLWSRADTLVWLDYTRPVVMGRVLRRSFARATYDRELWNGNTESFRDWADPEHPVRWAWSTFTSRRDETLARTLDPRWAHVGVIRLRSPRGARRWLQSIARPPASSAT
jgi:adenylate kinase family enzyme